MEKFTIKDFQKKYKDEETCLEEVFRNRYGDVKVCPSCKKETRFYKVTDRKCYACQYCGFQLHPLANTIFHKSETPLTLWFYAIYLFSTHKNGVSAKMLQRELGVTYKTAWRMGQQIRKLFVPDDEQLDSTVEVDETYIGGEKGNNNRLLVEREKVPVVGAIQRDGRVKAEMIKNINIKTLTSFVRKNVAPKSCVMTDEHLGYNDLTYFDYIHQTICHSKEKYVKGAIYTNTIESFWSQLKRSINGTYHMVSEKYLQAYVNEFAYRYNTRTSSLPFSLMISKVWKHAQ